MTLRKGRRKVTLNSDNEPVDELPSLLFINNLSDSAEYTVGFRFIELFKYNEQA